MCRASFDDPSEREQGPVSGRIPTTKPNGFGLRCVWLGMAHAVALVSDPVEDALPAPGEEALGQLFDAHHVPLYRLARPLTRDSEEARDLVQETFLRLARSQSAIRLGPARVEAWLVRVLVNLCRDRQRRLRVRQEQSLDASLLADPREN